MSSAASGTTTHQPQTWMGKQAAIRISALTWTILTLLQTVDSATVPQGSAAAAPRNPVVDFHVDLTSASPSGVISIVSRYRMENPNCTSREHPIRQQEICPFMHVDDENQCGLPKKDPRRLPHDLRQAVCLCLNCPGMSGQPCCKEHHVTIPVVHCDTHLDAGQPNVCTMTLQSISESCVCTRRATS